VTILTIYPYWLRQCWAFGEPPHRPQGGSILKGMAMDFPVYVLRFGEEWQVVFPKDQTDTGHTDFWEQTVSFLVAKHFKIPQLKLVNLPYSQRRARIVGNRVYYGGRPEIGLLQAIRKATGNNELILCFDDHERRLKEDVLELRRLIRRYSVSDQNQPRRKPGQRR